VVDVDDATAERWKALAKRKTDKKKGEKLSFEVATPSAPAADLACKSNSPTHWSRTKANRRW
jgi:hypothetical protein